LTPPLSAEGVQCWDEDVGAFCEIREEWWDGQASAGGEGPWDMTEKGWISERWTVSV